MKTQMNFTIGSDPELMVYNRSLGRVVSSLPILPNKENPIDLHDGIFVYSDNVLMEAKFSPVITKNDFVNSFRQTFIRTKKYLGNNFEIIPMASHVYDDSELKDREAWRIGCTPSYNCYTNDENEIVKFKNGMRTGSAHIHIGNGKLCNYNTRNEVIRLLDIFVGCASVILERDNIDVSKARRMYYGRAGEFRPTPYGLEYRVLSPFVLWTPELMELVYDLVDFTLSIVEGGETNDVLNLINPRKIQTVINNCDVKLAKKILNSVQGRPSYLPDEFIARINGNYNIGNFDRSWGID